MNRSADKQTGYELIDVLRGDHARLHVLLERVQRHLDAGEFEPALPLMREFALLLSRHVYAENEVLVPAFDLVPGTIESEALVVMMQEHEAMQSRWLRLQHLCMQTEPDAAAVRRELADFVEFIEVHHEREERIVYPLWEEAVRSAGDVRGRVHSVVSGRDDDEVLGDSLVD